MYGVRSPSGRGVRYGRIAAASLAAIPGLAMADYQLNLQPPATPVAANILELHNLILIICAVIFVLVFAVMFYSIVMHRKSRGFKAATFHDNLKLEVLWTVVPFFILVGMAIPSTTTLIAMSDVSKADMTVNIIGYQWKWRYEFPEQDISYFSVLATPQDQIQDKADKDANYLLEVDHPLVLPVGKKIRLIITGNDVIHSWWVPQFGVKKDAIPGYINESWVKIEKPGVYRGQCAELCGSGHGFMPIVVNAVTQEEFDKWVVAQKQKATAEAASAQKTWTKDELMVRGKQVYGQCAACHQADGKGVPGTFPALAGSKIVTGPLEQHIKTVLHGLKTPQFAAAMPAFGPQLSDVDIAAVITYERNSFGNKTGDVVQPAQVKAAR
jgi:cytochrome c oxidase subunit II